MRARSEIDVDETNRNNDGQRLLHRERSQRKSARRAQMTLAATSNRAIGARRLSAALLPLLFASGCFFNFERTNEVRPGEVKGRVVNEAGEPLALARVSVVATPLSARSNADGNFLVKGLPSGVYRMAIVIDDDANGFPSDGAVIAFTLPPDAGLLLGDVVVKSATTLTGRVAYEDGSPAPGARVSVYREFALDDTAFAGTEFDGAVFDGPIEAEVVADRDGAFVVPGVVEGEFRIFAEGDTVGDAQTFTTATPDDLELTLPNVAGEQLSPEVVLAVTPSPTAEARIFLRKNLDGTTQDLTRAFTAGEAALDGLAAGRYDVRVCQRGAACDLPNVADAVAYSMPLPPTGARYRWGPLSFSDCVDCDSDGVERFISVEPRTVTECGDICAGVYDDPTATCEFDGQVRDCDDDGDGQPDIFEPSDCRLGGQGGDRDNDGICDRDDAFPDCSANVAAVCTEPGAFPVGTGILPGQGPVAPPLVDECALAIDNCNANADCVDAVDGFTCACRNGFEGDGIACVDVDECADVQVCGGGTCTNNDGGYVCTCDAGFERNAAATTCVDIDECVDVTICGTGGACTNVAGSFECVCSSGFVLNEESGECVDVNECLVVDVCGPSGVCTNAPGDFSCVCEDAGYAPNGSGVCENIDECVVTLDICGAGSCTDEDGSYLCACDSGYNFDGTTCVDVDECNSKDACGPTGNCTNLAGSFRCECAGTGYEVGPSGLCENIDECTATPDICGAGICTDQNGTYSCACDPGYFEDAGTCVDVDECSNLQNPPCGQSGATCLNEPGGFTCDCGPGVDFVAGECIDVDECASDPCDAVVEVCLNEVGSFTCECADGYADDGGGTCVDVDECADDPNPCSANAACANEIGSFNCTCNRGFVGDGLTCAVDNAVAFCTPAALPAETFALEEVEIDFSGANNDRHGRTVAISDDGLFALVGAPNALDPFGNSTGAVYLYQNGGTSWFRLSKIIPNDAVDLDDLGFSVAINSDGTKFAFGAPANDVGASSAGAVWVYSRSGTVVTFEQRLDASNPFANAAYGTTLAMSASGDVLAVGAPRAPGTGAASGAVYLYTGDPLAGETTVVGGTAAAPSFGEVVALDALGDTLIVGARNDATNAGTAFVFQRAGAVWNLETELLSPEPTAQVLFGDGLAIAPDASVIVVGARRDDSLVSRGGAAYVYERVLGSWTFVQKLRANSTLADDEFAGSVTVGTGGVPLILGTQEHADTGKAIVYAIENGAYCEQQTLEDGGTGDDFGYAVDVTPDGSTLLVGDRFGIGKSENSGVLFIYTADP